MSPRRFSDMVGNAALFGLLRRGYLPPSALFSGPEGVGKKTAALLLAALANCHQPENGDLCGSCSSCRRALDGLHPDIVVFGEDGSSIKIDAMRQLRREAQYRPYEGRARFFIINEAEKMTHQAANCILKTLEEPPPTTHIILVSAYPRRLLPTIRSRCQIFRFASVPFLELEEHLREAGESEHDPALLSRFSEGSVGTAQRLDLKTVLQARDRILEMLEGWLETGRFTEIFERCEKPPLKAELKKRENVLNYLKLLKLLCYDLYYLLVETPDRIVNLDRVSSLQKLGGRVSLKWLRELIEQVERAERDVEHYVNSSICFQTLWLETNGVALMNT